MEPTKWKKILPKPIDFKYPSEQDTSSSTGNQDEAVIQQNEHHQRDAFIEHQEDHVEIYYNEQDSYSELSPTGSKEDVQEHDTLPKEVGSSVIHPSGIDSTLPPSTQGLPQIPPHAYPSFSSPPLVNFPNYQTHNIHLANPSSVSHQLAQGVSILSSQPVASLNSPDDNMHPQTTSITTDQRDDNATNTPTSPESPKVSESGDNTVPESGDNTVPSHASPQPKTENVQPDINLDETQECSSSSNMEATKWKKILPKPDLKDPTEQATSSTTETQCAKKRRTANKTRKKAKDPSPPGCKLNTMNYQLRKKALLEIRNSSNPTKDTDIAGKVKSYVCSSCSTLCEDYVVLLNHVMGEATVAKNTCPYCQKFCFDSHLREHLRLHTGDRPYACATCNKTFKYAHQIITHKRKHSGERPFMCEYCGKSYMVSEHLTTHLRKHTGVRPYTCDVCGKSFTNNNSLKSHHRVHKEKEFQCQHCLKWFQSAWNLKQHTRIHTGERFHCQFCEKTFTQKWYLKSHEKTHTGGQ